MKTLFKVFFALIFLFVIGIAVAAFAIPKDKIRDQVIAKVEQATGRTVSVDPAIGLTFFPELGVTLKDVKISNPKDGQWKVDPPLLSIKSIDVALKTQPLLQKKIEVARFTVNGLDLRLERQAGGKANWEFDNLASDAKDGESGTSDKKGIGALDVKLGTFDISDSRISYVDRQTGGEYALSDVDIQVILPTLSSDMNLTGAFTYQGERVTTDVSLSSPQTVIDTKKATVTAKAAVAGTTLDYAGAVDLNASAVNGKVKLAVNSIKQLVAFASPGTPPPSSPFDSFTLAFDGQVAPGSASYKNMSFDTNILKVKGEGGFSMPEGGLPTIKGVYNIDKLDLDRFMAAAEVKGADPALVQPKTLSGKASNWDTREYDFSGLKTANLDITANVAGYSYDGIEVGANTITVTLTNGLLKMLVSDTPIFGGTVRKDFSLNATGDVPSLKATASMSGLKATELMNYLVDHDNISGTVTAKTDIAMKGRSQDAMVKSTSGTASFEIKDGAISGVDMMNWVNAFQDRLATVDQEEGAQTKFVSLTGSATIDKGIATQPDLSMKGPLVAAKGGGTIDMPKRTLDYRLSIKPLAKDSLNMPFTIKGGWDDVKVRPDYNAVLKEIVNDPEAIEKKLQDAKKVGKQIEDSFEADKERLKQQLEGAKELKDLIRGF